MQVCRMAWADLIPALVISPGSSNPVFTERGLTSTFRVCGRDDQQGSIAANYIAKTYAGKNIAVVHDRTAYGKGLADEVKRTLATKKITPAVYEAITPGEKDYSALISKMKAAKINKIIVLSHIGEAEDEKLAKTVDGVDIFVGGHSHTLLSNTDSAAEGKYPIVVKQPSGAPSSPGGTQTFGSPEASPSANLSFSVFPVPTMRFERGSTKTGYTAPRPFSL